MLQATVKPVRRNQQIWLNEYEAGAEGFAVRTLNILVVTTILNLSLKSLQSEKDQIIASYSSTLPGTVGPGFVSATNTNTAGYLDKNLSRW